MRLRDMYVQPGYLIRRLHQRSTAEFAAIANGSDITQIQLSILLVIAEFPRTDATRISELIGSDRTTVGQALLRLEGKRLLRRRVGINDKRTKRLVITPQGEELAASLSPRVSQIGSNLLRGLSSGERETFLRLLTKLVVSNEGEKAIGLGTQVDQNN